MLESDFYLIFGFVPHKCVGKRTTSIRACLFNTEADPAAGLSTLICTGSAGYYRDSSSYIKEFMGIAQEDRSTKPNKTGVSTDYGQSLDPSVLVRLWVSNLLW